MFKCNGYIIIEFNECFDKNKFFSVSSFSKRTRMPLGKFDTL